MLVRRCADLAGSRDILGTKCAVLRVFRRYARPMDDTAEILERLERISALARAGVERSDLLREVRGLLEEGERRLRSARAGLDPTRKAAGRREWPGVADTGSTSSAPAGLGKEATVA